MGQRVEGAAVDAEGGAPLREAFVSLVDEGGRAVASTLTDPSGAFRLRAPAAGGYRVRVERIGYETWVSDLFHLAPGGSIQRRLEVPVRPISLEGLRVEVESRCDLREGAGLELGAAWGEVRKALELTRWTEEQGPVRFEMKRWSRELDVTSLRVEDEKTWEGSKTGSLSFVSLPPEDLAENGYVRVDSNGAYHFYAPDARVLVSEAFMRGHCFSLSRGTGDRAGLVGLAFHPVEKGGDPDVEGALWLDEKTAELRELAFDYTDVKFPVRGARASFLAEFRRLPTGGWYVRRWRLRIPRFKQEWGVRGVERKVYGYQEEGGEVTTLALPDGRRFELAERGTITGTVRDSLRRAPLAGARVWLAGTSHEARTDEAGRFRLALVPPGRYAIAVGHPDPLLSDIPGAAAELELEGDEVSSLSLPFFPSRVAREVCPEETGGPPALVGRVRAREGEGPPPEAVVWIRPPSPAGAGGASDLPAALRVERVLRGGDPGDGPEGAVVVPADAAGVYVACGLPGGKELEVRAASPGRVGDPVTLRLPTDGLEVRDLEVSTKGLDALASGSGSGREGVSLRGVVRSADTGRPVTGAMVRLLGIEVTATTGNRGTFELTAVPPGRYRAVTEYLGLGSDTVEVEVSGEALTLAIFTLETRPVELPDLRIELERGVRSLRLVGFYERMARGGGDYITREDLGRGDLVAAFRRLPGVKLEQCVLEDGTRNPECWDLKITRGARLDDACPPRVYLDGHLLNLNPGLGPVPAGESAFSALERFPRELLEGIEIYRDPATAPAQYQGWSGCGVILAWTRGRG